MYLLILIQILSWVSEIRVHATFVDFPQRANELLALCKTPYDVYES